MRFTWYTFAAAAPLLSAGAFEAWQIIPSILKHRVPFSDSNTVHCSNIDTYTPSRGESRLETTSTDWIFHRSEPSLVVIGVGSLECWLIKKFQYWLCHSGCLRCSWGCRALVNYGNYFSCSDDDRENVSLVSIGFRSFSHSSNTFSLLSLYSTFSLSTLLGVYRWLPKTCGSGSSVGGKVMNDDIKLLMFSSSPSSFLN